MADCPDSIKRLIDRFTQQSDQIRSPDYNETLIRIDFINPLMSELGWDIDNRQGFAERYREVVHEDRVKVAGQTKAPDYSFRVGGQRKFFLEAKKPAVDIRNNWEPAYQLRRYAWSAKLACSLLTDFEEFAIYDARIQPKQMEKASVARREYIRYTDYPDRWDFLSGTFSKDAVLKGEFDRYCESKKGRGAQLFDDAFLGEIEEWRKSIANSLAKNNDALDEPSLNFAVQRIIDRIIFLRIAEDRGTERIGQLQALLGGEAVYPRLCKLFRDADARYNSGLFHFVKEKDRDEAPDTLTPGLEVDDKTLKGIIKGLYYPQSPYEFTMVSADILGSVYERFLGKVITLTAGHNARIEEKPEVRKAGGVYYTPTYIVDYIVKNTVGKLLESAAGALTGGGVSARTKPPVGAPAVLKILDPACGSGSFLIGAYQFLLDWYHAQYTATDPAALATGKNPVLRPALSPSPGTPGEGRGGGWSLTIAERKRILLDHIHGVDLDGQAVEVTKLNLLLKCLEGETSQTLGFEQRLFRERALPDLGKNILCGNSLIGTDIIGTDPWNAMTEEERRRINPFDYERAFPGVFKGGGFDAVIGNPPYIRIQSMAESSPASVDEFKRKFLAAASGNYDIYVLFVERATQLMKPEAQTGFILPSKFFATDYGESLRRLLTQRGIVRSVVDFKHHQVFDGATTYTCLLFLHSSKRTSMVYLKPSDATPQALQLAEPREVSINLLTSQPWSFEDEASRTLTGKLRSCGRSLLDSGCTITRGSSTGADPVFILTRDKEGYRTANGALIELEPEVLRTPIYASAVGRYEFRKDDSEAIIFPYVVHESGYSVIGEKEFRERFPKAFGYLAANSGALRDRKQFAAWYSYSAPRGLHEHDKANFFVPLLANKSLFAPVPTNAKKYCLMASGGFSVAIADSKLPPSYVLSLLNSKLMFSFLRSISNVFRGGWITCTKQYVGQCPIPEPKGEQVAMLTSLADAMLSLHKRLSPEQLPQRREQIQREIDATDRQIDQLVYELYGLTDDEIKIVEEAMG